MKKILIVVGTRPNFIKVTQFKKVCPSDLDIKIVHTGQHFDALMADVFFEQFKLKPDFFLDISAGSPITQMAEIMLKLEKVILEYKPNIVLVAGDVNSTIAAALTVNKIGIKLGHIESGLRSFDRIMPEEINRILTDEISDYFFVTEKSGIDNLIKEGKNENKIFFVGNTMIDTLVAFEKDIDSNTILDKLGVEKNKFVLMTMHRPATVDSQDGLEKLVDLINEISGQYKIVFPIHPRTLAKLRSFGIFNSLQHNKNIIITEPLDYFAFQKLIKECKLILTDSGGIQEEATFMQVPCLTLRPNTERPVTVDLGTNTLVNFDIKEIQTIVKNIESGNYKNGQIPPLWDGKATERILNIISTL
jgi:UDP-N-acetylglucosamine 2-epimerase (non-hydrolysing)